MGPAFTTGEYLCRYIDDPGFKLAFMHIYKQIPLDGTELDSLEDRKKQATIRSHVELNALKKLTENECTATPKLLGYQISKQDANDLIPRGYIIYLLLEKFRGYPLEFEKFGSLLLGKRNLIRVKFKVAYMFIIRYNYDQVLRVTN